MGYNFVRVDYVAVPAACRAHDSTMEAGRMYLSSHLATQKPIRPIHHKLNELTAVSLGCIHTSSVCTAGMPIIANVAAAGKTSCTTAVLILLTLLPHHQLW